MRRKFFWKLALTFLALLAAALLAVDFLAERALRTSYENDAYRELQSLVRLIRVHPIPVTSFSPQTPDEIAVLHGWVSNAASSGARSRSASAGSL